MIGNAPIETPPTKMSSANIFFEINKPWYNPDSIFLAAMGKDVICGEYSGIDDIVREICRFANRYGSFNYQLSEEENEKCLTMEEIDHEKI